MQLDIVAEEEAGRRRSSFATGEGFILASTHAQGRFVLQEGRREEAGATLGTARAVALADAAVAENKLTQFSQRHTLPPSLGREGGGRDGREGGREGGRKGGGGEGGKEGRREGGCKQAASADPDGADTAGANRGVVGAGGEENGRKNEKREVPSVAAASKGRGEHERWATGEGGGGAGAGAQEGRRGGGGGGGGGGARGGVQQSSDELWSPVLGLWDGSGFRCLPCTFASRGSQSGVWGLGSGVWGSGSGIRGQGLGFKI